MAQAPSQTSEFGAQNVCSLLAGALEPCTIVIFGASGDLAARKLLPALFDLARSGNLATRYAIVGCGRTPWNSDQFRERMAEAHAATADHDAAFWPSFAEKLHYLPLDYDSPAAFAALGDFLSHLDRERHTGGNRLFYLATPPSLYAILVNRIGQAGLADQSFEGMGWVRIVVEKPFGHDLGSALALDRTLHENFAEQQIFRIDHYLAKETVQNVLMLRFANAIFEPLWNRGFIDYVGIIASEELGVEHRAGYYEQAGVLRDMFQNHMMQLLTLTAMEPPSRFEAEMVQDEKAKVVGALKPLAAASLADNLVLGQYRAGAIGGRPVAGYLEEPGVSSGSTTPTFAMLRLFVDNWRWRGVPFYLVSGKRLARKITRIVVQFKGVPHSMFRNLLEEQIAANRLRLGIFPHEQIDLSFQAKMPGSRMCLQPVTMEFKYQHTAGSRRLPDAYARVLLDCILGDHMLFLRQDAVELSWAFLTPILEACESCGVPEKLLKPYNAGAWGPESAWRWLRPLLEPDEWTA